MTGKCISTTKVVMILLQVLSELLDFYPVWNHQKTLGFFTVSGEIEVRNRNLALETEFSDHPIDV